jgi:hypothetical protein
MHKLNFKKAGPTALAFTLLAIGGGISVGFGDEKPETSANIDSKAAALFRQECSAKAKAAEKKYQVTVQGKNGWMFFAPELRHVGAGKFWGSDAPKASQSPQAENADPLPAILDFKSQLDKAGVELLIVPVPPKSVIYADAVATLGSSGSRLDEHHKGFYDQLKINGINLIDLVPEFLAHRADAAGAVYCKQDTHWSGRACVMAARAIAAEISQRPWLGSLPKKKYEQEWKRITIEGDLWLSLTGKQPAKESLPLRFVGTRTDAKKPLVPVPTSDNSPIVLLGDSHDLVFHEGDDMHTKGAGLPDQLAFELGMPVDLIAVRGSGATPARMNLMRRVKAKSGYLGKKKLVIWCFSAREFTETMGWQKVPVVR